MGFFQFFYKGLHSHRRLSQCSKFIQQPKVRLPPDEATCLHIEKEDKQLNCIVFRAIIKVLLLL